MALPHGRGGHEATHLIYLLDLDLVVVATVVLPRAAAAAAAATATTTAAAAAATPCLAASVVEHSALAPLELRVIPGQGPHLHYPFIHSFIHSYSSIILFVFNFGNSFVYLYISIQSLIR